MEKWRNEVKKENRKIEVDSKETTKLENELIKMFLKGISEIFTKDKILEIARKEKPKEILENKI